MKKKIWIGLSAMLAILMFAIVACTKEPTPDPYYPGGGSGGSGGNSSGSAPSTPTGVSASVSGSQIKVTWNRVSNANYYKIYYSQSSNGSYDYINDIYDTEAYVSSSYGSLPTGDYYFKVRAINN
ncbi:MAG: fibronectin type III domain-containing protein [Bacteroidales bacterium]|nr:fibronectin type III domain-containing protein [Bacteroidales bacterium]